MQKLIFAGLSILLLAVSSDQSESAKAAAKKELAAFNSLIGEWRGVGQPRRGSSRGAWSEKAEWVWHFGKDVTGIRYNVKNGKLMESGLLTYDPASKRYTMKVTVDEKHQRTLTGKLVDDKLVLLSQPDDAGKAYRLTVTKLNEKRTLVLHEEQIPGLKTFKRVAEVGYTRAGVRLAREGGNLPVCIVTEGAGTIAVQHEGKTYYVCCSGCRQAFEDDPAGIIADYKANLAKSKN